MGVGKVIWTKSKRKHFFSQENVPKVLRGRCKPKKWKLAYFLLDPPPVYDISMTTSLNAITWKISALKISELLRWAELSCRFFFLWRPFKQFQIIRHFFDTCPFMSSYTFISTVVALVVTHPLHHLSPNILLRSSSDHSNSVLTFPYNICMHTGLLPPSLMILFLISLKRELLESLRLYCAQIGDI